MLTFQLVCFGEELIFKGLRRLSSLFFLKSTLTLLFEFFFEAVIRIVIDIFARIDEWRVENHLWW